MGDGVLVYFGYPHAHEDDAEQAVRAGLALIDAVGELQAPQRLQVRIGIATGLVVVGDLIGSRLGAGAGDRRRNPEPRGAAASAGRAGRHRDCREHATADRRAVRGRDLGPQSLKGFAEPQRAWRVLSENRALGRFEALRSGRHAARRPRRGAGPAASPLGAGEGGQRARRADLRRARRRQIPPRRGAGGADRRRAAHSAALFLLAAPSGQRAASDHRPA